MSLMLLDKPFHFWALRALENYAKDDELAKYWFTSGDWQNFSFESEILDKPSVEQLEEMAKSCIQKYKDEQVFRERVDKYNQSGALPQELLIALWEKVVEGRDDKIASLQAAREKVKKDLPKA